MKLVNKVFKILELFLDHGDELALEEISRLSGLNKPTTRRIALALVECGYLRQPARRGKYSLGMKFLDYSGTIKMYNNVIRVAAPHLMQLKQDANESVTMAIWDGTNTALCQSFLADHPLKVVPDEGSRLVLHATSVGKAALAEFPDDDLHRYVGVNLKRYTPNTITDINDLKKHLMIVRQEGVAFDDEEYNAGIRGIGKAIKNGEGNVVGAIGVLGPTVRLTRARVRECVPMVKACALEISLELGYSEALPINKKEKILTRKG
jgi:IclR family KDG regulon transcriptional repressor